MSNTLRRAVHAEATWVPMRQSCPFLARRSFPTTERVILASRPPFFVLRDCFVAPLLAMTTLCRHCEERSDEAIPLDVGWLAGGGWWAKPTSTGTSGNRGQSAPAAFAEG